MYPAFIQKELPNQIIDFNGDSGLKNTPPIIKGNVNSVMVGNGSTKTASFDALKPGTEKQPFTIEVWAAPLSKTIVYLFDQSNAGLWMQNGEIIFSVDVANTEMAVKYTMPVAKAYYIVATYDSYGMSLFVDGREVSTLTFLEQNNANWISDSDIVIGGGSGRAVVDGYAFYTRQLNAYEIRDHYDLGRSIPAITTNLSNLGGIIYNFEDQAQHVLVSKSWPNWSDGYFTGVEIVEDSLYSLSGGIWQGIVSLKDYDIVQRGKVSWVSTGTVVVQYSVDNGVTWTNITNNSYLPGVAGASPFNVDFKVTLSAGATMSSLSVKLYGSLSYESGLNDGTAAYSTQNVVTAGSAFDQIEYREDRGVKLNATQININKLTADTDLITGVDVWFKRNSTAGRIVEFSTGQYFNSQGTASGGTLYLNGGSSYSIENGEWVHGTFVLSSPSSGNIVVGAGLDGSIGSLTIYRKSITGKQSRIYRSYFGGEKYDIQEPSFISIAEASPALDIYSYNWSPIGS